MSRTPVSMCAVLGRRVLWGAAVVMNPGWSRHSRAASGKFRMFGRDNPRVVIHWMGHTRSVGEPGAPERRRWRMALAGPVIGVAGAVVLLAALGFSRFMASSTDELVATFALQLTLTAVACVLWLDPRQRSSAVLVGLAVVAISASVMNSEEAARRIGAYWPMVGWAAEWWAVVPLLVVLLRYPEARIRDRLSRAIVVAATAVFVVWRLLYAWFWDPVFAIPGYQGPMRWLTLPGIHTRTWNDVAARAETVASLALMALVVVVMVRRFRSASGLSGDTVRAVSVAGVALAVAVGIWIPVRAGWPVQVPWDDELRILTFGLWAVAPVALLVVTVRARLRRARLVDELLHAVGDVPAIERTLARALEDERVTLHIRVSDGWVDSVGNQERVGSTPPDEPESPRERRLLLAVDGSPVVYVDLTSPPDHDEPVVTPILAAAAVAMANSRLSVEREANLAEVRASRSRVVEAGLAERRRLERDLHDGVQQHLLALSATLSRVQLAAENPEQRDKALDDAQHRVAETMSEVRALGRGVHPTILSQGGLAMALPRLESVDPRVTVELGPELVDGIRLDPDVEAGIYFSAAELVTNALKHADANVIRVTVTLPQVWPGPGVNGVRLLVENDGKGVTAGGGGSDRAGGDHGVIGVRDRAAGLGGTATFTDRPGGGRVVEVQLPATAPRSRR